MPASPEFHPPSRESDDSDSPHPPNHGEKGPERGEELAQVRDILGGSVPAWHRFVLRYGGLLESVVGRYVKDPEERRTAVIDLLGDLYRGKLAEYRGKAALSTWLVPVARSVAVDHLRRRLGRPQALRLSAKLDEPDRTVFRMVYLQGLGADAVIHRLAQEGRPLDRTTLFDVVDRLEAALGPRALRNLGYQARAGTGFSVSARLLEFFDSERIDAEERMSRESPDRRLQEKQALERIAAIEALIDRLPPPERKVVRLKYFRRWTAKRIAGEVGLSGPREIYTLLDRAMRSLRRWAADSRPQGAK